MVQLHTGVQMYVGFWMQHFQTGGFGEMVRHPGHHDRRTSPPLTSFYGGGVCKGQSVSDTSSWYYESHLESKERFAIKKYLLIIGKKKNMQVLSHTFTYFST